MYDSLPVFNVMEHGAVGDGATDDTLAIQNTIAMIPGPVGLKQGGGIVFFPEGTYLISSPLRLLQAYTAITGHSKGASVIRLDPSTWLGTASPVDSPHAYMLDKNHSTVTDCTVSDITFDGNARGTPAGKVSAAQSGILVLARDNISRVNLYDIWGYGLFVFGDSGEYAKVLDCEADLGSNTHITPPDPGNDCIGGGGKRVVIERFHWNTGMAKNTALDFITGGGSNTAEVSVDLIDCLNESQRSIHLEGAILSSVRGCRFYGNQLFLYTNGNGNPDYLYNPLDILVKGNTFYGLPNDIFSGLHVSFSDGNHDPSLEGVMLGGRVSVIGNDFVDCDVSAIQWSGDNVDTSYGGSIISANTIYNPNQTGGSEPIEDVGPYGESLGSAYGCGIAVLNSEGLTIQGNVVLDTTGKMQYSMQLVSASAPRNNGARLLVQGNLCGSSPGVGNGSAGTFYIGGSPTAANPWPILLNNTNQPQGYDATTAGVVPNGAPWPAAGGYPYNAFICVSGGGTITFIDIGGVSTGRTDGSFYVPVGQTFTIKWTGSAPNIKVFQS